MAAAKKIPTNGVTKKAPAKVAASTPVRNTPIPKVTAAAPVAAPARKEITHDQIARRAFEIYCSGTGGSETDNWLRAERELRGGL